LAALAPGRSSIPFYSTVTGGLLDGAELGAEYWWRNVRQPVLFESAARQILASGANLFVEVGPHPVLRAYLADCLKDAGREGRAVPTLLRGDDAPARVRGAVGQALAAGAEIRWPAFFPSPGEFVRLPNYPWQRERHWHAVTPESLGLLYRKKIHPLLGHAMPQRDLAWESQVDVLTHPTLADHVIGEAAVFPGTGFAELALAAALAWHPGEYAEVADLEIRSPLVLGGERSKLVRLEVDAQDGSFSVKARDLAGADPLAAHAAGRILREPGGVWLRQEAPALPWRDPDFDGAGHERMTQALGLAYGPAYRAIGHGWVLGGDTALAVFRLPEAVRAELGFYHLHPALLDSAFQLIIQILKEGGAGREGFTFVPAQVGRIAFRVGGGRPHLAKARLLRRSPHSLLADFTIFDEAGQPLAFVKEARFRSVRLRKGAAEHVRHLECRSVPRPHPFAAAAAPSLLFEQTHQAMKEAVRRCVLKGTHRRYSEEVDPLLDGLCSRFATAAFEALADGDGGVLSWQAVAGPAGVPEIAPYLHYLAGMLQEDGLVEPAGAGWKVSPFHENQATAEDIWNSLVSDYPDHFKIIHAVGRVGMHLRRLLDGGRRLQAICPRDASLSSLRRQVLGAGGRHAVGKALHDLIQASLDKLPEGQRLGVLEISEGPPLFALDVCQAMDFARGDYGFASADFAALEEARRLQEKFPSVGVHPIGSALAERAFAEEPGRNVHLALVSVDFMDVRDTFAALDYARARLAKGASLVLLGQHPARWIDFVFGGQSGWWSESPSGARNSRQQLARFWQRHLEQSGFGSTAVLEFAPGTVSGPYLLVGQFDGALAAPARPPSAAGQWLVLADEQGYSAALAERLGEKLAGRGGRARVVAWAADVEAVLREARSAGPVDGIVHLAGLNAAPPAREAARRLQHQVERCAAVAALAAACEATRTLAPCWIVTAGAMADTLPSRRPSGWRASVSSLGDSALWGFVRTLANESAGSALRLVDLEEPFSMEAVAAALDLEFAGQDEEREVVVTAAGGRFVPRLRLRPRHGGRESAVAAKASVTRLCFPMPGQLRNLRWEEQPRVVPGEGELEVEVQATGLNFRDVMYALGMLSDEAIENGFAGPSLGLEFAGVVRGVGGQAAGFAVGDRVVGFGPSSFGSRVVTQAGAAAHIPPGISFEAAATIPSAFFTAYYALHHLARLGPEEKVLIHGAAGGVGIAAIQVAKWCGAEIFATAGSDEKRDFLRLLGVEHIYDSRSLAFADEILAATAGKGVDVVLNSLAGEAVNRNLRLLKPFGRFLELGKRDFYENTRIGLKPFRNNISYFGIDADQLMSERPALTGRLFAEVMALFAEGVLYPLPYHAFEAEDVVDAFRYMQQSKQIGKVVVTYRNGVSASRPEGAHPARRLSLSAEGVYLVTGGLGGFGLQAAQWLVARGARRLVLLSRSGPATPEAAAAVAALERTGARVVAAACDVADKRQLQALLREASERLGALKGVFHAAMVVDDALVRNLDEERIARVFEPKILGAQNLHELTLDAKLDYFVLFSSATTLFGNPGQGSYVAANTWLEALARHRLGLGLPATAVLFGAIADAGFLARNEKLKEALQSRMGGEAMPAQVALDALEAMLVDGRSGEGVLEFDWKALARFLPGAAVPKFAELALQAGDADNDGAEAEDVQKLLAELPDAELAAVFADMLRQEVGEILRIAPEKIDAARSLYSMGLDSLMGVELAVALESRFGVKLPVMSLGESPTIDKLAARIIAQLRGAGEAESGGADVLEQVRQLAGQHAAEVTEEAVARFADDIRAGGAAPGQRMIP
jgi:NADPH:quinone reductase-like Zn-dependent oxidoreductase/NAD(P)-dependent dehydrogenase (short-subunit alcohol dehydrogenase family)/acyl carrier protein